MSLSFRGDSMPADVLHLYASDELFLHFTSPREKDIAHERSRKYTSQEHFFILSLWPLNAYSSVPSATDVNNRGFWRHTTRANTTLCYEVTRVAWLTSRAPLATRLNIKPFSMLAWKQGKTSRTSRHPTKNNRIPVQVPSHPETPRAICNRWSGDFQRGISLPSH